MSTSYNRKRKYSNPSSAGVKKARLSYSSRTAMYGLGRGRFGAGGRPTMNAAVLMRQGEKKGVDVALTQASPIATTTNTNDNALVLNLIQSGTGSWNRIGRKAHLESIRLKGNATAVIVPEAVTGALRGGTLRMVVVWDKQPSGAAIPAFDNIFGRTDQNGTESTAYLDPPRYDNMDRFKVLKDCVLQVNPTAVNALGGTSDPLIYFAAFDEYIKLGGRETVFSGQSSPMTIADISTGGLYVYFRADNTTGTTWSIESDSVARLRYTD